MKKRITALLGSVLALVLCVGLAGCNSDPPTAPPRSTEVTQPIDPPQPSPTEASTPPAAPNAGVPADPNDPWAGLIVEWTKDPAQWKAGDSPNYIWLDTDLALQFMENARDWCTANQKASQVVCGSMNYPGEAKFKNDSGSDFRNGGTQVRAIATLYMNPYTDKVPPEWVRIWTIGTFEMVGFDSGTGLAGNYRFSAYYSDGLHRVLTYDEFPAAIAPRG